QCEPGGLELRQPYRVPLLGRATGDREGSSPDQTGARSRHLSRGRLEARADRGSATRREQRAVAGREAAGEATCGHLYRQLRLGGLAVHVQSGGTAQREETSLGTQE